MTAQEIINNLKEIDMLSVYSLYDKQFRVTSLVFIGLGVYKIHKCHLKLVSSKVLSFEFLHILELFCRDQRTTVAYCDSSMEKVERAKWDLMTDTEEGLRKYLYQQQGLGASLKKLHSKKLSKLHDVWHSNYSRI